MSKHHEPIIKEPWQHGLYNVTIVHDLFTITTLVLADDDEDATVTAKQFLTQDQGLPDWVAKDAVSVRVELEGVSA